MIEIRIIETNTSAWDKAMNGIKIDREVIDHKGKSIVRSYGLPEECLEKKKTVANAADTLDGKVIYLKGFIQQLKKDGCYLVDGEFQSLTKEDEFAMKKKLQSAKKINR